MTYRPPFARMRQIKQNAPPPLSSQAEAPAEPASVDEALERVIVVEEPEQPEPEPEPVQPEPEPEPVQPEPEPEPVQPEQPEWSMQMKKADLIALAASKGLSVNVLMTKSQIIELLQAQ